MSDETGTVYVYGLVKEWANGENDKSFAEIGLEAGDIVTIWTLRAEHNGSPQAGGNNPAIYKGHEDGVPVTYPEGTVFLTFPDGRLYFHMAGNWSRLYLYPGQFQQL